MFPKIIHEMISKMILETFPQMFPDISGLQCDDLAMFPDVFPK